jgi:hypothetical protein
MKHNELRSIAHNVADSLASGIGLLIGVCEMDAFGEAVGSPERYITVDFLTGRISGGKPSEYLAKAAKLYCEALPRLCKRHGVSVSAFRELTARYYGSGLRTRFLVTIEDEAGRRSSTEYGGTPGQRVKILDTLGRLRPKPVRKS